MTAKRKKTNSSAPTDRATRYALDVVAGKVVAGPHVRNACRRHLDDLKHGHERGLVYDLAAADRAYRFFETKLRLNGGQFEGLPFILAPSQAFKVGSLFGWKKADGTRRFRRAYIEEGKGNGKSPFAGGVGLYGMVADDEAGAEIYAAAAHKDQAMILFRDAVKMVRQSPDLAKRLTFSGGQGREYNIAWLARGSFMRPISREAGRTGSGPRPHFALCDEVHEHPDRSVMELLERGFKFRRNPLLLMITNSGTDRNSVCYEEHEHAVRVAAGTMTPDDAFTYVGEVIDDTTFSFVCALDPGDDPLNDPSCWPKANPLLGTILSHDYLAGVVAQAKAIPGKLNGILRLHFCVWTDSETAWMSRDALEPCLADFDPAEHEGKQVVAGIDLAATQDMTAVAYVVKTGEVEREIEEDGIRRTAILPMFDAWVEAWTPADTVAARSLRDKAPYELWVQQGHLRTTPGQSIRLGVVAAHLVGAATRYTINPAAYDNYAFDKFADELSELGATIPTVEHPQGGKRRAKPNADAVEAAKREGRELPKGLWMPGSVRELEALIYDKRIRIRKNPVTVAAMMSAVTEADAFDNRWFVKEKATNRIDALVALAMAVGAATMQNDVTPAPVQVFI